MSKRLLAVSSAMAAGFAVAALLPAEASAACKVKVGFMLPYSGTYAALGNNITDAFKLRVQEAGGKLAGCDVEYAQVDDESAPPKAKDNALRLVSKEGVDVLVGTVHSGVAEAMAQVAKDEGVLTIVPNAGAGKLTGSMCAPNIFRTSFSNWQASHPAGKVALADGIKKVVTLTWNYPAGNEAMQGFKDSFTAGGGQVVKELRLDFPNVEFQPYLTEIAALRPDAVVVFFAGGGALKFLKDYEAAGLKGKIPLYASGFLTDGVWQKAGSAAEGVKTTLHYADAIDTPKNKAFREAFKKATGRDADVYAVQGYDSAELLRIGLEAAGGDVKKKKEMIAAMEKATIDSPRGKFTLSTSHNPVQDFYLRVVENGDEKVAGIAMKALADPGTGCTMGK